MNACPECLPCLAKNALSISQKTIAPDKTRRTILSESLRMLADADLTLPPPCYARKIIDLGLLHSDGSTPDPYLEEKDKSTLLAKELITKLSEIKGWNPDSFESRLRLSVAGNILDFSIYADLDIAEALRTVTTAFTKPIDIDAARTLEQKMNDAQRILFILDNCGEAVFDRIFIEPYRNKTTIAVRGRPAFNDITRRELFSSGYDGFSIVDNTTGIPGVKLDEAGDTFVAAFNSADLIIAKGQGNFETMSDFRGYPLWFLFLAKCPVVCNTINAPNHSIQIRQTLK